MLQYYMILPVAAALLAAGCGGDGRSRVSGFVKHQGKPLKAGVISFIEVGAIAPSGGSAIQDGKYEVPAEAGLKPGTDVAVAALTCEPEAALMTPSLTSLKVPTRETVIQEVADAILQGTRRTKEDLVRTILPQIRLLPGESSGKSQRT